MVELAKISARTAWLFTRGRESVRLEARDADGRAQLAVFGPGTRREILEFVDTLALLIHQAELERQLVRTGFLLETFMTDRRRYPRDGQGDRPHVSPECGSIPRVSPTRAISFSRP